MLILLLDYQLKQKNKDTNQTRNSFSALASASTSGNHNDDSIIVGEVTTDLLDDVRSESSDDMENVYDETLDANVQLKQSGASTPHKKLWNELAMHKHFMHGKPWVILGDFNASLSLDDTTHGASNINISMREFNECVHNIEVIDVNSTGLRYTWNQKPHAKLGILKKIDRVMCNLGFNQEFPGSYAIFQPYRISDHSPAVLKVRRIMKEKSKNFKFFNFLAHKAEFMTIVGEKWEVDIHGVTPPKSGTTQRNGNNGVLLQGTKHKSRKTTSKETF
ncbi:RNA-directed DNA polymerase, eukaryota, reverse transcriptase zinc-binding domain protein [Tanacetum coccineum]